MDGNEEIEIEKIVSADAVPLKEITDDGANGTIEDVMIAPIGQFIGSDKEGNPVEQNFTEESLEVIANDLNESGREILLDKDHNSAKDGLNRDTQSLGWFSKFIVKPLKGLFAALKLTKTGRELIENREYRHVSPVFRLGENGEPAMLVSVAATNTPAIDVPENVILNSKPNEETEMTKEEIIEIVKNTFADLTKKETTEEVVENNCSKTETKNEEPETTVEEVKEEIKEDAAEAAVKEEPEKTEEEIKEEVKEEIKEEPEVIKEEALNQAPTTNIPSPDPEWKTLSGKKFIEWCEKHPELCR
jgi:phage I-like protein